MRATDPMMKRCSICGEGKPLNAFAKRTRSADGLQQHCKPCGRQALDAATARRAAAQVAVRPLATNLEEFMVVIQERALDVVIAFHAAAEAGTDDVLGFIADALEPSCPAVADDYIGPECHLHWLAWLHEGRRSGELSPLEELPDDAA
jgi:hypothetical protein